MDGDVEEEIEKKNDNDDDDWWRWWAKKQKTSTTIHSFYAIGYAASLRLVVWQVGDRVANDH